MRQPLVNRMRSNRSALRKMVIVGVLERLHIAFGPTCRIDLFCIRTDEGAQIRIRL